MFNAKTAAIAIAAATLLCATPVNAQSETSSAAARYATHRLAVGIGVGRWTEPWESRGREEGILTTATARFNVAQRWALETSVSKADAGWSFGGSVQYPISPVWIVGIGPLVTPVSPVFNKPHEHLQWVMTQALTTVEVPVTGRIAAFTTLQVNFTAQDYGNMWLVGGVRVAASR